MDDLISRKAAIDAILAVTGNSSVRELYEHVQEHGLSEMWSGGVNAAIDIIIAVPSAQPEQRWIPCSERLPEKEGYYLTTTIYKEVYCDYWNGDNFDRTEMVIAWMPKPKPYKERMKER